MDTQTIDQEFEKLQAEFADVATTVKALADKLQTAANGGDANAKEWLGDLELIAKDIDEEQTQAKVLLLVIHRFIAGAPQTQDDSDNVESADNKPLYAAGHEPQQAPPQQVVQPVYVRSGGLFGGGMMGGGMFGGYMGGGFAQAMEMGAGMSLGASLISSIFR